MALVRSFPGVIVEPRGLVFRARVHGRERRDGTWEGWIEFDRADGAPALRTRRETTQPNLAGLEHWATGLTPVYLEGALRRARAEAPPVKAAGPDTGPIGPVRGAVLDPFSVYLKGADLLRRQLGALSRDHLLAIIRAYHLDDGAAAGALTTAELIALIVRRASEGHAA